MPTHPSLAVIILVLAAIITSSDALVALSSTTTLSSLRPPRNQSPSSATTTLSYSDGKESDVGNLSLPQQFDPRAWLIPRNRRVVPRFQRTSKSDTSTRAKFIIQRGATETDTLVQNRNHPKAQTEREVSRARPLRIIRRIVLRQEQPQQQEQGVQRNIIPSASNRLPFSNHPQLDEILDTSDLSLPAEMERNGARRVTFKATKEASKTILSKPFATLTDFMTQPVSQYSLLSYHDAEGVSYTNNTASNHQAMMSRRWLIRRLTKEESRFYVTDPLSSSISSEDAMEESNLFRLAVPLLPLIGWDLTPVIDLEVIPPRKDSAMKRDCGNEAEVRSGRDPRDLTSKTSNSSWAPLRGIRNRISPRSGHHESIRDFSYSPPPVVKIRSLRVSLLSTQKEVNDIMMNKSKSRTMNQRGRGNGGSSTSMQREAIEMVGRVEEWLKPHITFEAEISWNGGVQSSSMKTTAGHDTNDHGGETAVPSNVTVKSTAITSLTVPKIPSEILRKSVPSAFLVKRLGATLTSRALAICLPRFLMQLEKDYNRWSGL